MTAPAPRALATAARETVTAWAMLLWGGAFAVVSMLLAGAPGLVAALALLVGLGVANISFNTLARTLLQLGAEPTMQGRVIALHAIVFLGSTPIGGPLIGWVCEQFGSRVGLLVSGMVPAVAALALLPILRRVNRRARDAGGLPSSAPPGQPSPSAPGEPDPARPGRPAP